MDALQSLLEATHPIIENKLAYWLPKEQDLAQPVRDAMRYAMAAGGKRLRPALLIEACNQCDGPAEEAQDAAFAIECIHTYSLIHDDLPAMDDDDLRRGKPTVHKAYDEATAILAGDGLQALAFQILAQLPNGANHCHALAKAIGLSGMVGGQSGDIACTKRSVTLSDLRWIHERKTAALFGTAAAIGAQIGNATPEKTAALENYGQSIGLAFQIIDDVLDHTAEAKELGKTPGKDLRDGKNTFVSHLGIEDAKAEAEQKIQSAIEALRTHAIDSPALEALGEHILTRAS